MNGVAAWQRMVNEAIKYFFPPPFLLGLLNVKKLNLNPPPPVHAQQFQLAQVLYGNGFLHYLQQQEYMKS